MQQPSANPRLETATLAAFVTAGSVLEAVARYGATLEERAALKDRGARLLSQLLRSMPEHDPAGLLAPSAQLRTLGLLRWACCVSLAERLDGGGVRELALRAPGLEETLRALEAAYPYLPADFVDSTPPQSEHGAARRRMSSYARVCAIGLEAGLALAASVGFSATPPSELAVTEAQLYEYLRTEESAELTHWSDTLWDTEEAFGMSAQTLSLETLAHLMRQAVYAGALYAEGVHTLPPLRPMSEDSLAIRLVTRLDGERLRAESAAWAANYLHLPMNQALLGDAVGLEKSLRNVFLYCTAYGYLGRLRFGTLTPQ